MTSEQQEELYERVRLMNEKLEEAARASANHAFNLGCSISLLPLAALVGLVFVFAGWVSAIIAGLVALIVALGLAALASTVAQTNALDQTYRLRIQPEIDRSLAAFQLSRLAFDQLAAGVLPPGASLRRYLSVPFEEAQDPIEDADH